MTLTYIERYLAMFRFQGWFFHDVTLGIVYGLTLLFGLVLFRMMFRRSKPKKVNYYVQKVEKESIFSFPSIISFVLSWFFFFLIVSHFALFAFGGGMSRPRIALDSAGGMVNNQLIVNKWQRSVNNGGAGGVSTSTAHFQLNALDSQSGKLVWNHQSNWHDKIIGETTAGLVMVNTEKAEIFVLDPLTGKESVSGTELADVFPEMKGKWSQKVEDYLAMTDNLYVYGLDGQYYRLNLTSKQLSQDDDYVKVFLARQQAEEVEFASVDELAEKTGEPFFNGQIIKLNASDKTYISHTQTRDLASHGLISAVDSQLVLAWQTDLGTEIVSQSSSEQGFMLDNRRFFFTTNGISFVLSKADGRIIFGFDQGYNRRLD